MIRMPLVNVPKEKKSPKPLKRTPLARATKPIRQMSKRGLEVKRQRRAVVVQYFKDHGLCQLSNSVYWAPCQMCGRTMILGAAIVDPCHKVRASQGGANTAENIVVAHRECHEWQHLHRPVEKALVDSEVNAKVGGVVQWPKDLKDSLERHLASKRP